MNFNLFDDLDDRVVYNRNVRSDIPDNMYMNPDIAIDEKSVENTDNSMTSFPEQTPLAMAYVPFQMWEKPYEADVGLSRGTIFPSIDKPFIGEEAVKNAHTK